MATFSWQPSILVVFIRLNIFVKIDLQPRLDNPLEKAVTPSIQKQEVVGVLVLNRFKNRLMLHYTTLFLIF